MKKRRSKKIGINGLTTLEADIMNIVWGCKEITVREVHETMLEEGYIPHTTILTAMRNMAHKGILKQKQNKNSRAYIYSAAVSRDTMAKDIIDTVVERVLGGVATPEILRVLKLGEEADVSHQFEINSGSMV